MARAIESGVLDKWNQIDPSLFNTHWRFWDEGKDEDRFSSDPDKDSDWREQNRQQRIQDNWNIALKDVPPEVRRTVEVMLQRDSEKIPVGGWRSITIPYFHEEWIFTVSGYQQLIEVRVIEKGEASWLPSPKPSEETQ